MTRVVQVVVTHTNACRIGITPILDGVPAVEEEFSLAGAGTATLAPPIALRGTRFALRVRVLERAGDVAIAGAAVGNVPLRAAL